MANCCLEGVLDIKGNVKTHGNSIETGGTTTHGKWSYGSAHITGEYLTRLSVQYILSYGLYLNCYSYIPLHNHYIIIITSSLYHHHYIIIATLGVESSVDCTVQIKSASLSSRRQDALFVLLDGGRSHEAPQALKPIMKDIFLEEITKDEKELKEGHQPTDTLQYMAYTFLTAHR